MYLNETYEIILIIVVAAMIAALLLSISQMKRQERSSRDISVDDARVKHPALRNTILLGYILVPILIVILAALIINLFGI